MSCMIGKYRDMSTRGEVIYHLHYANMSVQYTAYFVGCKDGSFQLMFLVFFLFLLKT